MHEVGGDPEQPGPSVLEGAVVAPAPREGDRERLSGQLVGEVGAEAASEVAVQRRVMALENPAKRLGESSDAAIASASVGPAGCAWTRPRVPPLLSRSGPNGSPAKRSVAFPCL
jgi:hypothetical protein